MNIFFVSLGCDKNLVDSEVMLGLLSRAGYRIVDEESAADIMVVNTCCFIHDAKEESIETILECAQYKQTGRLKVLVVTGCLAQRYQKEIRQEIPEVDVVLGASSYDAIVEAIEQAFSGEKVEFDKGVDYLPHVKGERLVTTGNYTAYLKIAEGCNKCCTYCIIPKLRGRYRSVPMEEILETARQLVANGAVELNLVAQETTVYGVDLYGKKALPELLQQLCKIEGLQWVRLLYCYPEEITEELIAVMASEPKICHYIDMPIQHSEDSVLKRMGRRTSKKELVAIIERLRSAIPDIAIRTTLIAGFPGEQEEDYENLYRFVNEMEFDRLGVFPYSQEENTVAAGLPDQIPEEQKEQRRDELMELQQAISYEHGEGMIGKVIDVLIEGYLYKEDVYVGRSYKDAPKVDGEVFVSSPEELLSGRIVKVRITGFKEYDLIGEMMYEFTE
ncbi:MAG: 30S ribosomal protein S12 methylthiotransferase RimO [Lachnospiraceae bacterium]|nr:30S ribosomal protein S12 methylthiotransferase RimO [Lachnospiraceae bacterium]